MKTSYINLPNEILQKDLTANELAVIFYLSSIYVPKGDMLRVRQSTIARNCGLKTMQTVSRVTSLLQEKGLLEQRRCVYENNSNGTFFYRLRIPECSKGYFRVQRQILSEGLTPAELRVYLFICRSLSPAIGRCWNSYNDLARLIGIKRNKVIAIVAQLAKRNVIRVERRKSRHNRRVYADNHYTIVRYAPHRPIRKRTYSKKIGLLSFGSNPIGQISTLSAYKKTLFIFDYITKKALCQDRSNFFTSFFEKERRKKECIHINYIISDYKCQQIRHKMP